MKTQTICSLYLSGKTVIEVAAQVGCSRDTVYAHLKRENVSLRPKKRREKHFNNNGYVRVFKPSHPQANPGGYVSEHRLVAEKMLGRFLKKTEVVHHKNEIRHDNRESNLQVLTQGEHMRVHLSKLYDKLDDVVEMYTKQKLSLREIGQRFDMDHTNVAVFLRLHNIPIRKPRRQTQLAELQKRKKAVIEMYVKEKFSLLAIGRHFGVNADSVNRFFVLHNVPRRESEEIVHLPKLYAETKTIIEMYTKQKLSLRKIGRQFGVCHAAIAKFLRLNGISIRKKGDPK